MKDAIENKQDRLQIKGINIIILLLGIVFALVITIFRPGSYDSEYYVSYVVKKIIRSNTYPRANLEEQEKQNDMAYAKAFDDWSVVYEDKDYYIENDAKYKSLEMGVTDKKKSLPHFRGVVTVIYTDEVGNSQVAFTSIKGWLVEDEIKSKVIKDIKEAFKKID
ncbi:hypothetical protein [Vallitalea guaymasensis]|uniref:hypothetical protein n=1 Tax=Vallitalea guaymasensis TaxID=1185412 RepID=UPI000DE1E7B1|nr:hypothetical protein [Vallitalea guaymasensis]